MRFFKLLLLFIFISGCATITYIELDDRYGFSNPIHRSNVTTITPQQSELFHNQVRPILENRCIVCHGCYDAPCQLKMESIAGIERGANKTVVYDGARLQAIPVTNIQGNPKTIDQWRSEEFYPILNERQQSPQANLASSLMYQMLQLKRNNPLPDEVILSKAFDVSLNRQQECPTIDEFKHYQENNPLGGMPYALPNLPDDEYQQLTLWLAEGAKMPAATAPSATELVMVEKWETFLNGDSKKEQLVGRYLYEHLYLANLYFDASQQSFFNIVRSKTPPTQAVQIITTRRPFEDPNVERVYYRLQKKQATVLAKRHMPYRFDLAKLTRYKALFFSPDYTVEELPGYKLKYASNPFITFQALPLESRYRFLLDEAQFSIMNFIKGPVCRGQIALNVIEDQFWVAFENPENIDMFGINKFLVEHSKLLQFPAATSSSVLSILDWREYTSRQKEYVAAKKAFIESLDLRAGNIDLDLIWSGENNPNAALTIFRHFDSASVVKGFVGKPPKSAWVIGYPLLERIHYLLVAGFDVYGDVGHQLKTRLYMDFLRMEGESAFLMLLPQKVRKETHDLWYRETSSDVNDYNFLTNFADLPDSGIEYQTDQPQAELYQLLKEHTATTHNNSHQLTLSINDYKFKRLENLTGESVSLLPEVSFVVVNDSNTSQVFTLLRNSAHSNVAHLFAEKKRRLHAEDTLTVARGAIGTYPKAFFNISQQEVAEFIVAIENMKTKDDYFNLKSRYAVRRTNTDFWTFSDKLHQQLNNDQGIEFGLLDYNRLENK
jgi:hypothetical protein